MWLCLCMYACVPKLPPEIIAGVAVPPWNLPRNCEEKWFRPSRIPEGLFCSVRGIYAGVESAFVCVCVRGWPATRRRRHLNHAAGTVSGSRVDVSSSQSNRYLASGLELCREIQNSLITVPVMNRIVCVSARMWQWSPNSRPIGTLVIPRKIAEPSV